MVLAGCPMRKTSPSKLRSLVLVKAYARARPFTLLDAMVLIAATAIALLPFRFFLSVFEGLSATLSVAHRIVEVVFVADALICPLALSLSLALWVLRLRQPRPGLPRVFRQPGMAASTAILVYLSLFMTATLISLFLNYFASGIFGSHMFLTFNYLIFILIMPMSLMGVGRLRCLDRVVADRRLASGAELDRSRGESRWDLLGSEQPIIRRRGPRRLELSQTRCWTCPLGVKIIRIDEIASLPTSSGPR